MKNAFRFLRASLPAASKVAWKKASRQLLKLKLDLTGADAVERIRAERYQRGREQYASLQKADAVVVSFGKSGRTWLRVMVSRLYQQVYDLPEDTLIGFDNFHNMDGRVPRLFFTHDNYIGDYTGHTDSKVDFYDKKVLLMVRDPRDVAVSQFFQWKFRMPAEKKALNDYLPDGDDSSVFDFVMHDGGGLPKVIDFMNIWARERDNLRALSVIRYEDMRASPHETLTQVAKFLDIPADAARIQEAVDYASFENMKKKEADSSFRMSGARVAPGDKSNPDSYKTRRAKVGGFRDYFEDDQIESINALVAKTLDPVYRYDTDTKADSKAE
ncbi:sulfotransferase domain-containing protein [uncultured Roseovarius sp.]|uniref:sulfotransferase domain-containing protein n=1 Tax=uncultured Roseovarius sp. TaxID=293344 RepID=UPI0026157257|nr:sulfotransferase domain-containing protein [uncultured Roseovarius sp.]